MKKLIFISLFLNSLIVFAQPSIDLVTYATGFTLPVDIVHAGDNRLFIVEQDGIIKIIDGTGNVLSNNFIDIRSIVSSPADNLPGYDAELGLLGLAFHPDFQNNGYFYVNYTDNNQNTVISRFTANDPSANIADPNSELIILTASQPHWNHNGGALKFGPDGYLYIGLGDGGSGGDPYGNGQNTLTFLGKILRIDVDNGSPYSTPANNPFVGSGSGILDEIWAIGLRNPWKFSFDKSTGDLWIGDVGQNAWEEINFQDNTSAGGENYGWDCYEGFSNFSASSQPCNLNYIDPIHVYQNTGSSGDCSVTGGYVYRGTNYPNMMGHYIFTDYCSGKFWTLYDNNGNWDMTIQPNFTGYYSSFGEDVNGEIFTCRLYNGTIYRVVDTSPTNNIEEKIRKSYIYPNPTFNYCNVFFNSINTNTELKFYDSRGNNVKNHIINSNRTNIKIDISDLKNGSYIMQVCNKNNIEHHNLLITK